MVATLQEKAVGEREFVRTRRKACRCLNLVSVKVFERW